MQASTIESIQSLESVPAKEDGGDWSMSPGALGMMNPDLILRELDRSIEKMSLVLRKNRRRATADTDYLLGYIDALRLVLE